MFKIIPLPDNKGSIYSPFIIAALILITFGVSAYFIETAAERVSGIGAAGRIDKTALDMEEVQSEARTMAFHSLRSALAAAGNKSIAELEEEIASDMDARVGKIAGLSNVSGNYKFLLSNISAGRVLLASAAAPRACLDRSEVVVCSYLSIEEVIDRRWIH